MSHKKALQMMAMSHTLVAVQFIAEYQMQAGIKFQLRLPEDVKHWLELDADRNDRSMNSQVIAILRERMNRQAEEAGRISAVLS